MGVPLYPLALFAVALGGAGLGAGVTDRRRALTVAMVLALAGTAGPLWTKGRRNLDPEWIATKLARVDRLTDAIRPLVAAGGTVQVLDTAEGGVHALLRASAREPSRFLYDFHFYHDVGHPYVRRLRAELMDALRTRPPAAVALFGWGGRGRLRAPGRLSRAPALAPGRVPSCGGGGWLPTLRRPGTGPVRKAATPSPGSSTPTTTG